MPSPQEMPQLNKCWKIKLENKAHTSSLIEVHTFL